MYKNITIIALTATIIIGGYYFYKTNKKSLPVSALHANMRKLWEDHIMYTRNYIISDLADLPDVKAVADRLMQNQDDIGDAIKPYYGKEAGEKLASLLREHIELAIDVLHAAKENKKSVMASTGKKWQANADEIAEFLSTANPQWSSAELKDMLSKHLEYTGREAWARLKKDWKGDIEYYDKNHTHMLMFADLLADGIVEQFPFKFRYRLHV